MREKSLAYNAFFSVLYKILNVIFPLITFAYVARILLAEGVGRTAAVQNNISYFLLFASLGIPAYGIREIAKSKDNKTERDKVFSELFLINGILTIIAIVAYVIGIKILPLFQNELTLYLIYGVLIVLNFCNVDWLYQGAEEYKYIAIRSLVIKVIGLLSTFLLVREKADVGIYAIINVLATSGNNIFNIIHSRKIIRFTCVDLNLKRHIKPLVFLALCSISTELYARMDITMLDILSDNSTVGYYAYSQKIVNIIVTLLSAVTAVFLPRLSYLYKDDKKEFNGYLKFGFEIMFFISLPTCIGLILIAKPLVLLLLGDSFLQAETTLSILSFMIPLKCIGDIVCYQVMICAGREDYLMRAYFITMLINCVNNYFLIPKYGAFGAAIASVISEIIVFVMVLRKSKKYVLLQINFIEILKVMLAVGVMGLVLNIISFSFSATAINLLSSTFIGVLTYVLVCYFTKCKYFFEIVNFIKKLNRETL